jgi:uncharacterized protein YndB with AHSA1/START domain
VSELKRVFDAFIRATPEKIWESLTQPEQTRRYFYRTSVESTWKPGGPIVYRGADGRSALEGQLLEVDRPRKLAMATRFTFEPEASKEAPSRLTWTIEPLGEVTKVTVVSDGFQRETRAYDLAASYGQVLRRLQTLLETGGLPLQIGNVTFDCADVPRMVDFWTAALHYQKQAAGPDWGAAVDPNTLGPRLYFQKVPEGKTAKNRVHLDINAADREAEVKRLEGLGAKAVRTYNQHGETWTWMEDPEGNEFCLQ